MAASITEKPFLIDFAGNSLAYKLSGTPLSVSGRKAVTKWKIGVFPRRDYGLTINYGDKSFTFTVKTAAAATNEPYGIAYQTATAALKNELLLKIAGNFEIGKDFAVTVSDSLELTFTSLHHGGDTVTLSSSDPQAVLTRVSAVSGIERKMKNGYKLFAYFDVIGIDNGSIRQSTTPHILLSLDPSSKAALPLSLLRSYFTQADIPGLDESFRAYPLQYAVIKYRLAYSDFFDGKVQVVKHSEYRYAVPGRIGEAYKSLNLPDWVTSAADTTKLSAKNYPINYGCDSGLTVKSFKELPQSAYFMLFNGNADADFSSDLAVRVDILNEDGSTIFDINMGNVTVENFNIIRIPLSHGSLSLSDHSDNILSYTVRIYPTAYPERVWKRTFVLQEKPYFQHVFFLQNKLGVLESFFATVESREKTVEGEVVRKNGGNEIDITDNSTVFTVSTGCKSTHELELLEAAVGNPFNYKIVDGKAVPISILPDTFTIHDEAEETQSVQFQYMFNIEASDSGERSGIGRAIITTVHDYFETTWADERSAAVGGIGGVPEIWIDGERFNKIAVKTSLAKTEFNRI